MWSIVTDSVARSVGLSVTLVSPTKMAEPIEMPSEDWGGPRETRVTLESRSPTGRGNFKGEGASHCKV